jgi:hypothetical protein
MRRKGTERMEQKERMERTGIISTQIFTVPSYLGLCAYSGVGPSITCSEAKRGDLGQSRTRQTRLNDLVK